MTFLVLLKFIGIIDLSKTVTRQKTTKVVQKTFGSYFEAVSTLEVIAEVERLSLSCGS